MIITVAIITTTIVMRTSIIISIVIIFYKVCWCLYFLVVNVALGLEVVDSLNWKKISESMHFMEMMKYKK